MLAVIEKLSTPLTSIRIAELLFILYFKSVEITNINKIVLFNTYKEYTLYSEIFLISYTSKSKLIDLFEPLGNNFYSSMATKYENRNIVKYFHCLLV